MVSAEQHLRHGAALPDLGARVLRIFEQAVPVALTGVALLVREDARHHAADAVRHGHGRDLAAREHEVAEGYLLVYALLDEALVHALVVAAYEDKVVVIPAQALGLLLVEGPALRRHVYDPAAARPRLRHDVVQAALEGLGHHDEAPAAAVGVVVHLHLLVLRVVAYLDAVYLDGALLRRAAYDALAQDGAHDVREQGHDIYPVRLHATSPL